MGQEKRTRQVKATPAEIRKVMGSTLQAFSKRVLDAAMGAVPFGTDNPVSRDAPISATFAPRSDLEGMLIVRMITVHAATSMSPAHEARS